MRLALRVLSVLLAVTTPFIWTVGQTGLPQADKNLCELARAWFGSAFVAEECAAHNWFWYLWIFGGCLGAIFLTFEFLRWLSRRLTRSPDGSVRRANTTSAAVEKSAASMPERREILTLPQYMSAEEALHYMAGDSSWGDEIRQSSTAGEGNYAGIQFKKIPLLEAIPEFSKGAARFGIGVLGRLGGNGAHNSIPHTDWLTIGIDQNTTLRRQTSQTTAIVPSGSVPFYTDLQICRSDVHRVWPPRGES